jgi:DNA-binding GntR family transcriptional regulator
VLDASLAYLQPLIVDGQGWDDYQSHEDLLNAIAAGDTARTSDLMEQHMHRLEIEKEIEKEPQPDAQDPVDPLRD